MLPQININCGMRGFFRLRTFNKFSGKQRLDTGWFPNTILTSGRNIMATQAVWTNWCHVGTSSTAPSASDTSLLGFVAATSTIQAQSYAAQASAPYYGWFRKTYRFSAGAATGNLSEAGVGWGSSGATLISRALIVDAFGSPTTITVLSDEWLDVTYELRYYPPLVDVNGTVTLNGVSYNTVTRAASVTGEGSWAQYIGTKIAPSASGTVWRAFDGALGAITTLPSGNIAYCDNNGQFNQSYVNNSYFIDMQCDTGPTGWNLGAGIRCLSFITSAGAYQTSFSAVSGGGRIPKTSLYTMKMVWRIAWAEVPAP